MQGTKDFFDSKKALALVLYVVSFFVGFALQVPEAQMDQLMYVILGYLGAQGMADFGKGKAQITTKSTDWPSADKEERI